MVSLKDLKSIWRHRRELKLAMRTQLGFLDEDNALDALGGLTDDELRALISWLPEKGTFVEFGTLFGLTAKAVAAAKPELKVVAVDDFSWNPFTKRSRDGSWQTRSRQGASRSATGRPRLFGRAASALPMRCSSMRSMNMGPSRRKSSGRRRWGSRL